MRRYALFLAFALAFQAVAMGTLSTPSFGPSFWAGGTLSVPSTEPTGFDEIRDRVNGGTSWSSNPSPFEVMRSQILNLGTGISQPGSLVQDCLCWRYPHLFRSEYCPFCGRRLSWPASITPIDVVLVPIDEP